MKESYDHNSSKPFGAYAAKNIIALHYPETNIKINSKRFSKLKTYASDSNTIYFCIARNLYTTEDDAQAMLDYIYAGNTMFLSSANFDSILLLRLLCEQVRATNLFGQIYFENTGTSLYQDSSRRYQYYYQPFQNYFNEIRAENSFPIGFNAAGKPNSFVLYWGKGRLIMHCDPRAFSNYFLLKDDNYTYLDRMLTFIPIGATKIYWDDYFRNHNVRSGGDNKFSAFDELFKHPPLATALLIFLILLGLYVLFNSKRRQRIIPDIKRVKNSSVSFTETIARLYLAQKDNKNIAEKMITYFNEHIRKHYFMKPGLSDQDFISVLSGKSGVGLDQTTELFYAIKEIANSYEVDDEQLVKLNSHIQQFYKNKN